MRRWNLERPFEVRQGNLDLLKRQGLPKHAEFPWHSPKGGRDKGFMLAPAAEQAVDRK